MIDINKLRPIDLVYTDVLGYSKLQIQPICECVKLTNMLGIDASKLFPIPLTPKLLAERCGFTVSVHREDVTFKDTTDRKECINIIPNPLQRGSWLLCYKNVKIPVDALHELQQAYHCLFRTELKIIKLL